MKKMIQTTSQKLTAFAVLVIALVVVSKSHAAPILPPFEETFTGNTASSDLTITNNDFGATGATLTIAGEQLNYSNTTTGGDVAAALVQNSAAGGDFVVSMDVDVTTLEFTGSTRIGVVARGNGASGFNDAFSGYYAYVQEVDASGGNYEFRLGLGDNVSSFTLLQQSASFDLTDGTPDFGISLSGVYQTGGDLLLTASFTDVGGENIISPLTSTVLAANVLTFGSDFGMRTQAGFNTTSVGYDNITVAVPEPSSFALLALGGCLLFFVRRFQKH